MGWPVDEAYERNSNTVDAHRLQGELMLIVGELDNNVDPASTLQVSAALVKAGKLHELVVIPAAGHGAAETPYGSRKRAGRRPRLRAQAPSMTTQQAGAARGGRR